MRFRKRTPIGSLEEGKIVTIEGEVGSDDPVRIPMTGEPCVYYALILERLRSSNRGRGRPLWFVEKRETRCHYFTVKDDTGMLTVREAGENLRVENTHQEFGQPKKKKKRRYALSILRLGDKVRIRGKVQGVEKTKDGPLFVLEPLPGKELPVLVTQKVPVERSDEDNSS